MRQIFFVQARRNCFQKTTWYIRVLTTYSSSRKNKGISIRNPSVTGSCSWIHRWFMTTAERHRGETDSPWVWSLRASETWRTFLEMFDTWKMKRNKEHCPPHHWISSWKSFFHVAWKRALLMKEILRHFIFGQIPSVFILFDEREHNFLLQKLQRKQNLNHQQKKDNQTKILDWS